MTSNLQSSINPLNNVDPCMPASVAQLDAPSDWRPGGRGFNPRRGRQHSFVEIDHEIFSTVILSADSRRAVVSFWRKNMHNTD